MPQGGNLQGGMGQPRLSLDQLQDITCENCDNDTFVQAVMLKRVSALVSPNGEAGIVPIETFACVSCGNVNEEFKPQSN